MKIRLITPSTSHAREWGDALGRADAGYTVVAHVQPMHAVQALANGSVPAVVVVETVDPEDFMAFETLAKGHPEIDYVLIGGELSSELLLRAMRVGVREVLPATAQHTDIVAAVARLAPKHRQAEGAVTKAPRHAEVIGLLSSKGGSGATFIAANLAHLLAADGAQGRRVALIDLNLQFGDAALCVSSERPASDVSELARNFHRLDRELLQSAMTQISPGLWVLAAPEDPAHIADVTPQHVQAILQLAGTMFDYIVVDAGRSFSALTLAALDRCDRLYAVLQQTLPYVRDARRLRELFASLDYPRTKVKWIVNRYVKGGDITVDDLKASLAVADLKTLPNQYDVAAASVNQGVPLARLAPNAALTRALRELARDIAPQPEAARARWLGNLFAPARRAEAATTRTHP